MTHQPGVYVPLRALFLVFFVQHFPLKLDTSEISPFATDARRKNIDQMWSLKLLQPRNLINAKSHLPRCHIKVV